jgi:Uma2 family endonuclease
MLFRKTADSSLLSSEVPNQQNSSHGILLLSVFEENISMSAQPNMAILLQMTPALRISDGEFYDFCQQNKDYRIERTAKGEIVILMPTGGDTSRRNYELSLMLGLWRLQTGAEGYIFESSGGFILPSGSMRSPDLSWVKKERLDALTAEEREKFTPLCPDFVVEIRSSTDNLKPLKAKMDEYIKNGALLALLIDPEKKMVYLYRPHQAIEVLTNPTKISCDPEMPGLVFDTAVLFSE